MVIIKKVMLIALLIVIVLAIATVVFVQLPMFGSLPKGKRQARIEKSQNFKNGSFVNQSHTPDLTEGVTIPQVLWDFIVKSSNEKTPKEKIPSQKTHFKALNPQENLLIWFGHSSYYLQIEGIRILVDPVLSGAASPLPFTTPAFQGSDVYAVDEFPAIDYLIITHDHWDHLDYETVKTLKPKVANVICGLGVGAHLELWGYEQSKINELDWQEKLTLNSDIKLTALPARHFSGRGFRRNKSLWCSYAIQTPNFSIYLGGDSGYGTHFKSIGEQFGGFDFVILENGQYNQNWKYIHMMPDEVLKACIDLKSNVLMPVHSGKFALAAHAWYEPLTEVSKHNQNEGLQLVTPKIGEKVILNGMYPKYLPWWEEIR